MGKPLNKLNFDDFNPLWGQGGEGVCPSYVSLGALRSYPGAF